MPVGRGAIRILSIDVSYEIGPIQTRVRGNVGVHADVIDCPLVSETGLLADAGRYRAVPPHADTLAKGRCESVDIDERAGGYNSICRDRLSGPLNGDIRGNTFAAALRLVVT